MSATDKMIVSASVNANRELTIHFVESGLHADGTHAVRVVESADSEGRLDVIDFTAEQMDQLVAGWLDFRLQG